MKLPHWLVLLPLIAMFCACAWRKNSAWRRLFQMAVWIILCGLSTSQFISVLESGTQVVPIGSWGGSLGWMWVIDRLSALFLVAISFGALFFSLGTWRTSLDQEHFLLAPLLFLLVGGMNLSVCAEDYISLLLGVEMSLFAAYALFAVGAKYLEIRQAFALLGVNFIGTVLLLISVGLCYGIFRSFGLAQIASRVHAFTGNVWFICFVILFLSAWGLKMAFIPVLLGTPNIHRILPVNIGAFLAGIASKLGLYVLLRITGSVLPHDLPYVQWFLVLWSVAAVVVVLQSVSKDEKVGGFISALILGQVGVILLAVASPNAISLQAALLLTVSAMIVDAAIFLVGCALVCAHDSDDISSMGGTMGKSSGLSLLWIVLILVVAGIPPLSGFWGKYVLLTTSGNLGVTLAIAGVSFLMMLSMVKVWRLVFFGGGIFASHQDSSWKPCAWGAFLLALISLIVGLGEESFRDFFVKCSAEILDRAAYHAAIMESLRIF